MRASWSDQRAARVHIETTGSREGGALTSLDIPDELANFLVVIRVNMHDAKTNLSAYVARLREGEAIVLCRRNTPVAEIRLLPKQRVSRRPIGLAAGSFSVPASFFEPLPEDLVRAFGGEAE